MSWSIGDEIVYVPYPGAKPEIGVIKEIRGDQFNGLLLLADWGDGGPAKAISPSLVEKNYDESLTIESAMRGVKRE